MKSIKLLILIFSIITLLYNCVPAGCRWGLDFLNNTHDTLVLTYGMKKIEHSKHWTISSEFPEVSFYSEVEPGGKGFIDFPEVHCKYVEAPQGDSISIFVLSPDTVKMYDWRVIGKEKKYLKKITKTMKEYIAEEIDYFFIINDETE